MDKDFFHTIPDQYVAVQRVYSYTHKLNMWLNMRISQLNFHGRY